MDRPFREALSVSISDLEVGAAGRAVSCWALKGWSDPEAQKARLT